MTFDSDREARRQPLRRPARNTQPADDVRRFRASLNDALALEDDRGRRWGDSTWGVYAFFDYDGEPIYVGQTNERLRTRIRRHLTNQRTDAVAMRILDVFEVAAVRMYPLWELEGARSTDHDARKYLDSVEYSVYLSAIESSRFRAILNEKIPPLSTRVSLPDSLHADLIDEATRAERGHPDIRIARRAETVARLAAVARERGEVSDGLRRVLVIQSVRLSFLAACRLAEVQGRPLPEPEDSFNMSQLAGSVIVQNDDSGDEG